MAKTPRARFCGLQQGPLTLRFKQHENDLTRHKSEHKMRSKLVSLLLMSLLSRTSILISINGFVYLQE